MKPILSLYLFHGGQNWLQSDIDELFCHKKIGQLLAEVANGNQAGA